ncbi:MAG: hypothetical protein SNI91_08615 [Rikenellaceae bacterium]
MKKLLIILSVLLCMSTSLHAQVNKEVEVTKAYIPTVPKAEKPLVKATIVDTTYINLDVDYHITPLSINTPLQSKPISPATITYLEFNRSSMAQLKIGAGYPFNTLLKGYASGHNADVGYVAAKVDHFGNYSKIESIVGDYVDATEVLNSAAVDAGLYLGRYTLSSGLSYSNDSYRRYAFEQSDSPRVRYQDVDIALNFGDNFIDLSRLNFNLGAEYSHFIDRESTVNNSLYLRSDIGRSVALGDLTFGVDYKHIEGSRQYRNSTTSIYASIFDTYASWQMELGLRYYNDNTVLNSGSASIYHYIIPNFRIKRAVRARLTPFLEIGGHLTQNSFEELVTINPFIASGEADKSSVEYNLAAGVERSSTTGVFNYKLYFGYDIELNSRFYRLNVVEELNDLAELSVFNNFFELDLVRLNRSSLNAQLNYMPSTNFSMSLDGHIYSYATPNGIPYTYSPSKVDATFGVKYTPRSFTIGAQANYRSVSSYSVRYISQDSQTWSEPVVNLPASVNLSAYIDWSANEKYSIFVEGDNLLGEDIYRWPLYRGYGARFTAGVKINFR